MEAEILIVCASLNFFKISMVLYEIFIDFVND